MTHSALLAPAPALQCIEAAPHLVYGHVAMCISKGRLALFTDNKTKVGTLVRGGVVWLGVSQACIECQHAVRGGPHGEHSCGPDVSAL